MPGLDEIKTSFDVWLLCTLCQIWGHLSNARWINGPQVANWGIWYTQHCTSTIYDRGLVEKRLFILIYYFSLSLNIFQNMVKCIRTSIHLQKLNSPKLMADIGYNDYWVCKNDFCRFSWALYQAPVVEIKPFELSNTWSTRTKITSTLRAGGLAE